VDWGRGIVAAVISAVAISGTGCRSNPAIEARAAPRAAAPAERDAGPRLIRATGTIRAVRVYAIQVPKLQGQGGNNITLVKLTPSGAKVEKGDVLAEFDRTKFVEDALAAQAMYEDLGHQVRQKQAQNTSDAERRLTEIKQAEADLDKARLQLRKGPLLSEIDRLKNQTRAEGAQARLDNLKTAHEHRSKAGAAGLRILELQTERQKVALERARLNAEKLVIHAPLAGMVGLENIWRSGSMGPAREGDQLFAGQPLLKIFDPSQMLVSATVNEPDNTTLTAAAKALVQLDAYPDAVFEGRFESASPVATSAVGSPIKNFVVVFRLTRSDPRLLPDLSAAVVIHPEVKSP
jgi:HlyD family secretion protein